MIKEGRLPSRDQESPGLKHFFVLNISSSFSLPFNLPRHPDQLPWPPILLHLHLPDGAPATGSPAQSRLSSRLRALHAVRVSSSATAQSPPVDAALEPLVAPCALTQSRAASPCSSGETSETSRCDWVSMISPPLVLLRRLLTLFSSSGGPPQGRLECRPQENGIGPCLDFTIQPCKRPRWKRPLFHHHRGRRLGLELGVVR